MTELALTTANNACFKELGIGFSVKTRLCLDETVAAESNKEEPVAKKARSFFEFDKNEDLLKSVLTRSPNNCTILESKVSKKTASLFLVEIILGKDFVRFIRNDIYNKLRAIDDSLECLVSMFDNSDCTRRFQVLIDTSITRQKRCQSLTVYNWVHTIIYNLCKEREVSGVEREVFDIFVQQPKDRQRAIRKVTELDFDPLFTFLFSQRDKFSENYQIEHWARANKDTPFDKCDKFVCKAGLNHSVGYLRSYLEQYQEKRQQGCTLKSEYENLQIDEQKVRSKERGSLSNKVDPKASVTSTETRTIDRMASVLNRSLSFDSDVKN